MEVQKTESATMTEMLLENSIRWREWMTVPVRSIHTRTTEGIEVPKTESERTNEMLLGNSIRWREWMTVPMKSNHKKTTKEPLLVLLAMARVHTY
jgi:hypothetical protein